MASTTSPPMIGWVNLGINHDTAAFAVDSIRRWWRELGAVRYPTANATC